MLAKSLTKKKIKFAKRYVHNNDNGVQTAKEVFGLKNYSSAAKLASELIKDGKVSEVIEQTKKSLADSISDELLTEVHNGLLKSTRLDHMVFPLGPEGEDDINLSGGITIKEKQEDAEDIGENELPEEFKERTTLTDKEITEMLKEVNCQVRRIVHGNSARHVYFWSPDNMARDKALDKGYKLKRVYEPEGPGSNVGIINIISFRGT